MGEMKPDSIVARLDQVLPRFSDATTERIDLASQRILEIAFCVFGFSVRWITLAALGWYFCTLIPAIWDVPLAKVTLHILAAALFGVCGFIGVLAWAFRKGPKLYEGWGLLGLIAICVIVIIYRWIK